MFDLDPAVRPLARANDLVAEAIGDETVVYDGLTKEAHHLAPLAAFVFAAADGRTSIEALAEQARARLGEAVDTTAVDQAVAELEERGLITVADAGGFSRRTALRRGALVGAAALAAPLVKSLVTPEYGAASSLSSLSYVVMEFKGSDGKYYRVKVGGDGTTVCGWSFATPGTNCTPPSHTPTSDNCIPGLSVNESTNGSGQTQITISWGSSGGLTFKLTDVRIKCANNCHVALNDSSTGVSSPYGPVVGCP